MSDEMAHGIPGVGLAREANGRQIDAQNRKFIGETNGHPVIHVSRTSRWF